MNRNMILGRDFMQTFGVRLYYDLNSLRIKNVCVPFEREIQISSLIRLSKSLTLQPQTCCLVNDKAKGHSEISQD